MQQFARVSDGFMEGVAAFYQKRKPDFVTNTTSPLLTHLFEMVGSCGDFLNVETLFIESIILLTKLFPLSDIILLGIPCHKIFLRP